MPTYITLIQWTEQGVKDVKETLNRAEQSKSMLSEMNVTMTDIYWTMGAYDLIVTVDAPDDKTITAAALKLSAAGAIRTETMRAFNQNEMAEIIQKVG